MKKYEVILQDLEKKIFNDIYKTNDILPSENELSANYESSRSTVRQALKILEEKGLFKDDMAMVALSSLTIGSFSLSLA
ncbi:HTH-type transcriptional regulator TreR [Lactococcus lactis]|nr:HTH-type transcriptional regulator TreR [Lactococcus lactis]